MPVHKVTVTKDNYEVERLYQWDMNQVLCISGLSLTTVPEVHFAHPHDQLAIVRKATMDAAGVVRADIPNSLLQKALRIDAYVCTYEGDTFQTICQVKMPVHERAKPSDYEGTDDVEVYSLDALQVEMIELEPGEEAKVEKVMNGDAWLLRFSIPRGTDGHDGTSIKSIERTAGTGAQGTTDTYTVTLTDGSKTTFQIYNGKDGSSIQSIQRTVGNGAPGTMDTYTITLTDGSKTTFQVYNGRDGEGAGDMTSMVYDPQGKAQDIFAYADNLLKTIDASSVTFADGQTWQQKYDAGEFKGQDGEQGQPGKDGEPGKDGQNGQPGKDGTSVTVSNVSESTADGGTNVVTFSDGKKLNIKNGSKGSDGAPGAKGDPGHTPVKGTDYWTPTDKAEMINDVLAALPAAEGVSF